MNGMVEVKQEGSDDEDVLAMELAATRWELPMAGGIDEVDRPTVNGLTEGLLREIKNALQAVHWGRSRGRSIDDLEDEIIAASQISLG